MIVEGFLSAEELDLAREGMWLQVPRPAEYFEDPSAYASLVETQFTGNFRGPWKSWDLNRLAFHPDLLDVAERFLGSADLRLYKTELWAKYSGSIDYGQGHHRDYGNHSLVVPKKHQPTQMTNFLLLSDVGPEDGPTKVIPLGEEPDVPFWQRRLPFGEGHEREVSVCGPAGTLFSYRTDVFHRGSAFAGERRARFTVLIDYEVWGSRWTGKVAWPESGNTDEWVELMERATPRQRAVFGFPEVGDPYWDAETIEGVSHRYPNMDMDPYRRG